MARVSPQDRRHMEDMEDLARRGSEAVSDTVDFRRGEAGLRNCAARQSPRRPRSPMRSSPASRGSVSILT